MITNQKLPRILLVEDNDDDAEIITSIFNKNKLFHTIDRMTNGEDALDYLFRKGKFISEKERNLPNIVLLDINLPKINGIDVLRRMRTNNSTAHIPVFVFTSSVSDYNAFESYRLGVTSYIHKQTSFEKFEAALMETELYLTDYKVLIVEDNSSDAAILIDELTNSNLSCCCELVSDKAAFVNALENFKPDIIFCDYDLPPKFDAIQAVRLLKQTELKIPFILVTGKLDEDLASACFFEGMDDYLIKGKLKRFPVALINNLRKKKSELDKLELIEMLTKKEFRFKQAQEMAHIGDCEFVVSTNLNYLSDEACQIYGVPLSENVLHYDQLMSFVHREDKEFVKLMCNELLQEKRDCSYQYRIVLKNGIVKNIMAKCRPELDKDGNLVTVYTMIQDLTIIKRNEIALEKSLKNVIDYKQALDAASIVAITDVKGIIQYVNDNFCKLSKYSREELIGQDHRIVNSGFHSKDFIRNIWRTISNGKIWNGEIKNKAKDGTIYWVNTTIIPFLNENNKPYKYLSIRYDITEQKHAEAEILKAVERYDILTQATSDTIWDWDIVNDTMVYNGGLTEVFGHDLLETRNIDDWQKEKVHPNDLKMVIDSLSEAFENKLQKVKLNYRFRCSDGTFKSICDRACIIYDETGRPVRMIGAMQDISYQSEEEMRIARAILEGHEQERRYLSAELHDNINQILAGSLLFLGMMRNKQTNKTSSLEYLEKGVGCIKDAINEMRKLSHELAPASFDGRTLKDCFENLLFVLNINNQYNIKFNFDDSCNELGEEIKINLYRILQEQSKNILKYSHATIIEVDVTLSSNVACLRIFDNGRGVDIKAVKTGIGFTNIKKRAQSFSGEFLLNSAPGKGCEIIVMMPVPSHKVC